MAVSLLSSMFIAYLYVHFYSNRATGSQVHRAFPLLGISITAIFVTIQFSLPLSLGLLGALSIVRFRTPIKEPEEIGFIMLVISTSIAVATFKLSFVGIIFVVALAALFGQALARRFTGAESDGTIVISLPANGKPADPAAITALLRKRLPESQARERLANGSRDRRVLQLPGHFGHGVDGTAGRAERSGRPVHLQRLLQQTGRVVDASQYGASPRGCSSSRRRRFASGR